MDEINKIFVYGSLMEGFFNFDKYLVDKVESRKTAYAKGKLYHIDGRGYPAMYEGDEDVKGELLSIKDFEKNLKELDGLEQYDENGKIEDNEYNRAIIDVITEDGKKEKAYGYIFNKEKPENKEVKLIPIEDGDWRKFMESK